MQCACMREALTGDPGATGDARWAPAGSFGRLVPAGVVGALPELDGIRVVPVVGVLGPAMVF
jgi:hypothetical protein